MQKSQLKSLEWSVTSTMDSLEQQGINPGTLALAAERTVKEWTGTGRRLSEYVTEKVRAKTKAAKGGR